jgi:hypothetical protein
LVCHPFVMNSCFLFLLDRNVFSSQTFSAPFIIISRSFASLSLYLRSYHTFARVESFPFFSALHFHSFI